MGAGVAYVYSVTTIPEARRKGVGSAMTLTLSIESPLNYRLRSPTCEEVI